MWAPPVPVPDRRDTPARRLLLVLALLGLELWLVSGFLTSVVDRSPAHPYRSPLTGVPWLRAPTGGSHAWFRLDFGLQELPTRALLWAQGDQFAGLFVNGYRVAAPDESVLRDVDTAPDVVRRLTPYDLTAALKHGADTVGLEVVNEGEGAALARAVVVLFYGDRVVRLGPGPSAWKVTTSVLATHEVLPGSGSFSEPGIDDSQWVAPTASTRSASGALTSLPAQAFRLPVDEPAVSGPGTYPLAVDGSGSVPHGCSSFWLTVASSGSFEGVVDGESVVADAAAATFGDEDPLESSRLLSATPSVTSDWVYDISGLVRGTSRLHVGLSTDGSRRSTLAASVDCLRGSRVLPVITAGSWTAPHQQVGRPYLSAALVGNPLEVRVGTLISSGWSLTRLRRHLGILGVLGAGTALLAGTGRWLFRRARPVTVATTSVAAGLTVPTGVVVSLSQLRHWVDVSPPFPSTPGIGVLVASLAVAGPAVALFVACRHQRRRVWGAAGNGTAPTLRADREERRFTVAVLATAAALVVSYGYRIRFEPLWQDELSSLAAAQGMQRHVLPEWPSGFLYFKSELYTAMIAGLGALTHNDIAVLRWSTVVTYGVTVVAFGLGLTRLAFGRRRLLLRYACTLVFATAPFELGHARDIRMYQLAQLLVILAFVAFWRALRSGDRGAIRTAALLVVAMYLAHEETFILLPVFPLVWVVAHRTTLPVWRRWSGPALTAGAVIACQLALAKLTHPPAFGADLSGGPLIKWSPDVFYYLDHYFTIHTAYGATVTAVSLLGLAGLVVGVVRKDPLRCYLGACWIVPLVIVSTLLPAKDTRYCFVLLPFVFVLAFAGLSDAVGATARVVEAGQAWAGRPERVLRAVMYVLATIAVFLSLGGATSDYGLLVSSALGGNLSQRQQDYGPADRYVRERSRPGDVVVASGTVNLTGYGLGRAPTYWLPPRRDSRLLFLIEEHGEAVDTQYGIPVIDDAASFSRVVSSGHRTWVVIGDNYVPGLLHDELTLLQTRFRLVYESDVVSVFEDGGSSSGPPPAQTVASRAGGAAPTPEAVGPHGR